MKRRTSSAPLGVLNSHCRPPTSGGDVFQEQLRRAHHYYNWYLALELRRRAEYRAARGALGAVLPKLEADMDALNAQIDAAFAAVKLARQMARKRIDMPEETEEIEALKEQRKALGAVIGVERKRVEKQWYAAARAELKRRRDERAAGRGPRIREKTNPEVLAEMLAESQWPEEWKIVARIDAAHVERKKQILAACGLTPGTYTLVHDAVAAACKPKKKKKKGAPDTGQRDPRLKGHFLGEGRVGVQVHRLTVAGLLSGESGQIHLRMNPPDGKPQRYGVLRIRVGVDRVDNAMAELPVKLWRPLPADGVITKAWVLVTRVGPRTEYRLQFTIESESWVRPEPRKGAGVVAVDTGWRVTDDGIRVAYWLDDHGRHGQVVVPSEIRGAAEHADDLRSIGDKLFDTAREVVKGWLAANVGSVPSWMPAATHGLPHWHAHPKLIRVARRLAAEQLIGPASVDVLWPQWHRARKGAQQKQDLFASVDVICDWLATVLPSASAAVQLAVYLEWWRRQDWHLYEWETRVRRYATNARTEMFRKVAQVARQYERVLVEEIDLPMFARNATAEEKKEAKDFTHRIQRIASPGALAARIMEAAGERGTKADSVNTTRTCHRCEHVNDDWEHPERLMQTCGGCGAQWDQDENACRVMLARWHSPPASERPGDAPTPAPARRAGKTPARIREARNPVPGRAPETGRSGDRSQSGRQGIEMTEGPG